MTQLDQAPCWLTRLLLLRRRATGVNAASASSASYKDLEAISCDLSAFPNVNFFRVEVHRAADARMAVQLC